MKETYVSDRYGTRLVTDKPLQPVDQRPKYNALGEKTTAMSMLRIGLLQVVIPECRELCDVGPGNSNFIRYAKRAGYLVSFYDVFDYNSPYERVPTLQQAVTRQVVTFFDSLEHIESLSFLECATAQHIVVTVPCCPTNDITSEAFANWYHRRPTEHYYCFTPVQLENLFDLYGYNIIYLTHIEDAIRVNPACNPNTMTAIFQRR